MNHSTACQRRAIETSTGDRSLDRVMDLLLDAICVVDARGTFVFVSAACERIFGYSPDEMVGRPMIDLVFHADRARTLNAVDEIVAGEHKPHFENRYVRKDGRIVHIMWSAHWSETDQMRVAVARDVTERRRAESRQAATYAISEAVNSTEDLPALLRSVHHIICGLLPAHNFFVALRDSHQDRLSFPYHVDEREPAPASTSLDSNALTAQVVRTGQSLLLTRDNRSMPSGQGMRDVDSGSLDWLGVPLNGQEGTIGALVIRNYSGDVRYTEHDIELLQFVSTKVAAAIERKQMETRLKHIARHDPLTDLPNRELFHDRLRTAIKRAKRERTCLSLLYLDLDMFKQVNDTLGHATGDLLLQEVARRLRQCVREADTVGRIGGDEFLVLLNNLHAPEHALAVAEKIRLAIGQPIALAGRQLSVSPSIGIALYPDHGDGYEQLIEHADEAMYRAKHGGGNGFRVALAPAKRDDLGLSSEQPGRVEAF